MVAKFWPGPLTVAPLLVYGEDGDRPPPPHLGELGLYSLDTGARTAPDP